METAVCRICLRQEDNLRGWTVYVCNGLTKSRRMLKQFATEGEAMEFANEHARVVCQETGVCPLVNLPEECPCNKSF